MPLLNKGHGNGRHVLINSVVGGVIQPLPSPGRLDRGVKESGRQALPSIGFFLDFLEGKRHSCLGYLLPTRLFIITTLSVVFIKIIHRPTSVHLSALQALKGGLSITASAIALLSPCDSIRLATTLARWLIHRPSWARENIRAMSPSQSRLALTLQAIFYRIRLGATDFRYDSVRVGGFNVLLDKPVSGGIRPGEVLRAFPEIRSIVDEEIREAMWVHDAGMEALVFLYPFVSILLAGMPAFSEPARIMHSLTRNVLGPYRPIDRVEEVCVTVRDPNRCIIDTTISDPEEPFEKLHYLYKVTWHDGDTIAIDVTGAQFGYLLACNWADIELERGWTVRDVFPLGHVR